MPKLITEYLPSIADLKDEKYVLNENDKEYIERKNIMIKLQ